MDPAGQHPVAWAATRPDHVAIVMGGSGESRTYRELDERSSRVANVLRAGGIGRGDHVAVLLDNQLAWFDVVWGALRAGAYVTPINWHLTAREAGYIVADCGARALFAGAGLAEVVSEIGDDLGAVELRLSVGGDLPGFTALEEAVAGQPTAPTGADLEGSWMFYSSGTTGQPKGIKPPLPDLALGAPSMFSALLGGLYGFTDATTYLCPAPLYHAAPAGWTTGTQRFGATAVVMERFDPGEWLALVERHRVTHVQLVPTHLVRLLKLPAAERARYDLSSLEVVVHAAAPCPPDVKRAAIEWFGPIVQEYYAGSEGNGFCAISSEEWLAHPGSVGRSILGTIHILDESGTELATGEEGVVWFEGPSRFEYHHDPEKTASAWNDRGWSTLGDVGRLDGEGYLYLTDRVSNMIISGGVNIYPREAEDVLVMHPAVADVAVLGTPDPEMGEQVTAFVQPAEGVEGDAALEAELVAYCRERLSHFKCPRSVTFLAELPRLPNGKLLKRLLREQLGEQLGQQAGR